MRDFQNKTGNQQTETQAHKVDAEHTRDQQEDETRTDMTWKDN